MSNLNRRPSNTVFTRLALTFVAGLLLAGCGSTAAHVETISQDVLAHHDVLPSGALAQVPTSEAPHPECQGSIPKAPSILVETWSAGNCEVAGPENPAAVGQNIVIETYMFMRGRPLMLSLRRANGTILRRTVLPGQESQWRIFLGPAFPLGPVIVTARQGAVEAKAAFRVTRDYRGVGSNATSGIPVRTPLSIVVTGERPGALVNVDVYRVLEVLTAQDIRQQYVTTLPLRADAHGVASAQLVTRLDDEGSYLLSSRATQSEDTRPVEIKLDEPLATGQPALLPAGTQPRDVFQAHEVPPSGVAAQIGYFAGAGPSVVCPVASTTRPEIAIARDEPRIIEQDVRPTDAAEQQVQVGDQVLLCMLNFREHLPVSLTATMPDGRRDALNPVSLEGIWDVYEAIMTPNMTLGNYRIAARQGALSARTTLTLSNATAPGYRLISSSHRRPLVLVVGLRPHQKFQLRIYRLPSSDGPGSTAAYVGHLERSADDRGVTAIEFPAEPGDPHGCFAIRVALGQLVLTDPEDGTTDICLPYSGRPPSGL